MMVALIISITSLFSLGFPFIYAGTPVRIEVSMGIITISSLSEVAMVSHHHRDEAAI